MKDRIPGSPGRYSASLPVGELEKMQNGEPFAITLIRDDEPIVAGTPYSKAAVLPDALAQKLCPNIADPSPADAFAALEKNKVPTTRPTLINVDINNYVGEEYVGTYWCTTGCTNAPFDEYFYLEVNGNYQRATNYPTGENKVRFYVNKVWTDWTRIDSIHPPLTPGVEYLTTEKYNGKEVYTMLVDCGGWVDGKTVTVNVGQPINVFDSCGSVSGIHLPHYYVSDNSQLICMHNVEGFGTGATIRLCGSYNRFIGAKTEILIKYVKN